MRRDALGQKIIGGNPLYGKTESVKIMILENWSVVRRPEDPYQAPELWPDCLHGWVKDHPKLGESEVTTSLIKEVNGRIIKTASGSVYELGKVEEEYVEWCEKTGSSTRERLEGPFPVKFKE